MSDTGAPSAQELRDSECLHCGRCGLALPLQLANSDEPAMSCRCAGCGAEYRGNIDPDRALTLACNIVPSPTDSEAQPKALLPPEAIGDLLGRLVDSYKGPERRTNERQRVAIGVSVQPVDEQFNPMGPSFIAVTRNVSVGGMSMMHTSAVSAPFMIVEMPATAEERVRTRLQVLRCHRIEGFFEITGQFIQGDHDTDLNQTRDVRLSSAAWQVVDAVASQLRQSPDSILQSFILGDRSQAQRCRTRVLSDLAQGNEPH